MGMESYDPLGINKLTERIQNHERLVSDLERLIMSNMDLPINESMIMERTGLTSNQLRALRKNGLRSYKAGSTTMYIPSQFREDICKLAV